MQYFYCDADNTANFAMTAGQ